MNQPAANMERRVRELYGTLGTAHEVRDEPAPTSEEWFANVLRSNTQALSALARALQDKIRPIDEYLPQTLVTANTTSVTLLPQFEYVNSRIRRVIVTGPTIPSLAPITGRNTVTNPGAGATIINAGAPLNGVLYQVSWSVELEGTVTAADADNMRLTGPGGLSEGADYPGQVGLFPQSPIYVTGDGVTNLTVKTIGASSGAAAIYGAQISAVPLAAPFTLQLGDRVWNLTLPAQGILEFSADILLARTDVRRLTSTVSGPWMLELTGEADVRS